MSYRLVRRSPRRPRAGRDFTEQQYPQNFHSATINDRAGEHVALFHAQYPLIAFVDDRRYWYNDGFQNPPAWAASLNDFGFTVLSASLLMSPLTEADTAALSAAEWRQIKLTAAWMGETADELLLKEHAWLPALAPGLPLPVPVPQRLGEPSARFPRPWIVTTWLPGEPADRAPVTRGAEAADALAAFLTALHQPAPNEAPAGQGGRGAPLAECSGGFARQLAEAIEKGLIPNPDAVRAVWEDAAAAPAWTGPALWLHGDLHPANVLTQDGTICGVIDFGDLFAGDPAFDLAAAWALLPDDTLDRFHAAYRPAPDAATLRRARGWAVLRAFSGMLIGEAGVRGRRGGKATWGPPAHAALRRLIATAHR